MTDPQYVAPPTMTVIVRFLPDIAVIIAERSRMLGQTPELFVQGVLTRGFLHNDWPKATIS